MAGWSADGFQGIGTSQAFSNGYTIAATNLPWSADGFYSYTGALPMPSLIAKPLRMAELALQQAGILVPVSIGYFGLWPIKVTWVQNAAQPGTVLTQFPPVGVLVAANSPVLLTVSELPMNVAYPGTNLMSS